MSLAGVQATAARAAEGGVLAPRVARRPGHPTLANCSLLLALLWGLVIATGRLVLAVQSGSEVSGPAALPALGVVATCALVVAWLQRRTLYVALTSLPFAVVLLLALLLCTAGGTLVLQGATPDEYVARYGAGTARVLLGLGLDDVFHAAWFRELVGVLAVTLVLVPIHNRAWHLARLGHLAAHLGVVAILLGGLVGSRGAVKGRIDLREGQSADRLVRIDGPAGSAARTVPLGFSIVLDAFDVDHYADVWRLRLYEPDGDGWRATGSWDPREVGAWTEPPGSAAAGLSFRVSGVYPDLDPSGGAAQPRTRSAEWKNPAIAVEVRDGLSSASRRLLTAAGDGGSLGLPDGGVLVFSRRDDDVKSFNSRVAIVEDGRRIAEATIRVNEPFAWKGWLFYQANWRQSDPGYSGLQVVKDPGLPIVFAGFVLTAAGVLYIYLVRPRLLRRAG